jgi:hypothetical protein
MKRLLAFALAIVTATSASAEVRVEAASGDWKNLPQLTQKGYDHLSEKMQAKLFEIAESKSCPSFMLKQGRLDFRIGFAVQYDADGALVRLLIPRLDCPAAEGVAGGAVLEMLQAGDYAPVSKSSAGWYQGTLGFSFAGKNAREPAVARVEAQPGTVRVANPAEVVCERVEEVGTRLGGHRVCMTRAEWAQRRKDDREQVERAQTQRGCKQDQVCG